MKVSYVSSILGIRGMMFEKDRISFKLDDELKIDCKIKNARVLKNTDSKYGFNTLLCYNGVVFDGDILNYSFVVKNYLRLNDVNRIIDSLKLDRFCYNIFVNYNNDETRFCDFNIDEVSTLFPYRFICKTNYESESDYVMRLKNKINGEYGINIKFHEFKDGIYNKNFPVVLTLTNKEINEEIQYIKDNDHPLILITKLRENLDNNTIYDLLENGRNILAICNKLPNSYDIFYNDGRNFSTKHYDVYKNSIIELIINIHPRVKSAASAIIPL